MAPWLHWEQRNILDGFSSSRKILAPGCGEAIQPPVHLHQVWRSKPIECMLSYTSKYVGVLEGDLGVLSVKLPLRSLTELRTASNGSTVRRPSSAPIGFPVVAPAAARGVVANGAGLGQSATAIIHGSFAPRALRVGHKPKTSNSRREAAAALGESSSSPPDRVRHTQGSRDSNHLVHNAVSGFRLTQPHLAHHPAQQYRLDDDDRAHTASHRVRVQDLVDVLEGPGAAMETHSEPSAARMAAGVSTATAGAAKPHATEVSAPHELYLRYVRVKATLAQEASS